MRTATLLAFLLVLASGLPAQENWGPGEAIAEIRELVTKKIPTSEFPQRAADAQGWLQRVDAAGLELGKEEYLVGIAAYFARNEERAGKELLVYLEHYREFPNEDFAMFLGRIFFSTSLGAIGRAEWKNARRLLDEAVSRYQEPQRVYEALGRRLRAMKDAEARSLLHHMLGRALADERIEDEAKHGLLEKLYGGTGSPTPAPRPAPQPFKPFTGPGLDGSDISVADYKGKVLLIDYWATWCGPCMREMPNVVSAYEKYHEKGFEVLGVSLDKPDQAAKIRSVMKEAGMTWSQIYDGGYWEAAAAKLNGVRSIPATYLLDRTGKVRYRDLRGDALARAVAELIAETDAGSR